MERSRTRQRRFLCGSSTEYFEDAGVRLGSDPGGPGGARRTQFRRYVASLRQEDPRQLGLLGVALGALIDEVAASKQDFLVKTAERDGFVFADGVFAVAATAPSSFSVTRLEDLALVEDHGRRLLLLANGSPADAIGGAEELVQSVCRTVRRVFGEPAAKVVGPVDGSESALEVVELLSVGLGAKKDAALVRRCLQHQRAIVADLGNLRTADGLSARHARLAVGAAVTFARFVAETYGEHVPVTNG